MAKKSHNNTGNILGDSRAEKDSRMLDAAFISTHDFEALVHTKDFNFVVGRRGSGKSALFLKVSEYIDKKKMGYVYCNMPKEYEILELQEVINKITTEYRLAKAITRVAWRLSILLELLSQLESHYKFPNCTNYSNLISIIEANNILLKHNIFKRTTELIKHALKSCTSPTEYPGFIANTYNIEQINDYLSDTFLEINRNAYFFFDGLDEGWIPNQLSTAILGGLSACAADFAERNCNTHIVLFIRDNIYRSLNYFDRDFSRHIEGNTLRLNWDMDSLLHLATNRIRVALNLENLESNIKVWNRFAQADLKDKAGFDFCLKYTLYRPRDLIVLLNSAYVQTARGGRKSLIKNDIEAASKQISQNRLFDLQKEYDEVFPGLPYFIELFEGAPAFQDYGTVVKLLEQHIQNSDFDFYGKSDFAILGTGESAFFALYSVGFLGMEDHVTKKLQFCHDGSSANIDAIKNNQITCIHPCYWKALDARSELIEEQIVIDIYDDNEKKDKTTFSDIRTKKIGQLISDLPSMDEGKEMAFEFEQWVYRAFQILFSGKLSNIELKPNCDAVQRRDIVATNMAQEGFWKRVRQDYNARQIIIEVKNYTSLKANDFRQAVSYTNDIYGNFVTIVNRNQNEGLSDTERGWLKEMWDNKRVLVFILPAPLLAQYIGKLRSRPRFDYSENKLNKRLDTFLRSYLSLRHVKKSKMIN